MARDHGYKIKIKRTAIYRINEYLKVNFFMTKVDFWEEEKTSTYNRREKLTSI